MKTSYVGLFLLISHFTFGQLQENFNDGNFNSAPVWLGDTSFFKVNSSGTLQSKGPAASAVLHLSTPNQQITNTEWNFYIKLDFDPSTANYAKVYLSSDQPDLENALNGYFLKIGGESGTGDGIDLYKQQGTTTSKLIDGISGHAGKVTNTLRIKVIRDAFGNWRLFSDTTGAYNFIPEGNVFDNTITTTSYFGVVCIHSSTRKDLFYFDDIEIKQAPLSLANTSVIYETTIEVSFNKNVDKASAENPLNYSISTLGTPTNASLQNSDHTKVWLSIASPLQTGSYFISVTNVKDTSGIAIDSGSKILLIYKKPLSYGDLVISEIFADPLPSAGLPAEEFLELYNTSGDTIDLSGFTLSDLSTVASLPSYKLAPSGYLIIASSSGFNEFGEYGQAKGISPWPSLNNASDRLTIKDPHGKIIFGVNYSIEWYGEEEKKEGGWSLEMINPTQLCAENDNWKASQDLSGGTPGSINSVFSTIADITPPSLIESELTDASHITLTFNEALDTLIQTSDFTLNGDISITHIQVVNSQTIQLTLFPPLATKQTYLLSYTNIKDCKGNTAHTPTSQDISIPEDPDSLDIIINEILFNPLPGGVDFIEIYNKSDKLIDLKNWELATIKKDTLSERKKIFTASYLLPPNNYLCLTSDSHILESQYYLPSIEKIIKMPALPSFNNESGTAILCNPSGKISDRFDYKKEYHFPMIKNPEGISLERISFFAPTNNEHNWHSCSETAGYATPGYENSQHYEEGTGKTISIEPRVFTPDQDAWKDLAFINYRFNEPGYIANITVFDIRGAPVKILARNKLLDMEGFFQWDGTNEQGTMSNIGQYIVYFEAFNLKGEVSGYKHTVVLAQKF